jgi:uncharacterized protein YjdB
VTGKYSPSKATGVKVTFASKNKSVATIDQYGRLAAVKAGSAKIVVKAGGKSKTYTLKVIK